MTNAFRRGLLAASLLLALPMAGPLAQSGYPPNGAGYTPAMILPEASLSAVGSVTALLNDIGTTYVNVTGTYTGLTAIIEATTQRSPAAQTWVQIPADIVGGSRTLTLTANGTYRVDTSGFASVRARVTAISTGSAVFAMSGGGGPSAIIASTPRRATYSAAITALAPAASATDFFSLTGSATKTVQVNRAACSGISTAAATATVAALMRSTANSAGTSTAPTAVRHDSADPAATATPLAYTANPTLGTLVGIIRSGSLTTVTAATTALPATPLIWEFNSGRASGSVTLRGIAQVFALNGNAASFTSGAALNCSIEWTEE